MWKNYFGKNSTIIGVDVDKRCKQHEDSYREIYVEIYDLSSDDEIKTKILNKCSTFDIIIDDASHLADHQIKGVNLLYDRLNDGGIYLVEDIHVNYFNDYFLLKEPATTTFLDFIKDRAVDMMRYHFDEKGNSLFALNSISAEKRTPEEINDRISKAPTFTKENYAIHIYDSIIILEKRKNIAPPCSSVQGKERII